MSGTGKNIPFRKPTDWGLQVIIKLAENNLRQKDAIKYLNSKGFSIGKGAFSNLLRGIGESARGAEIKCVNEMFEALEN